MSKKTKLASISILAIGLIFFIPHLILADAPPPPPFTVYASYDGTKIPDDTFYLVYKTFQPKKIKLAMVFHY